MDISNILFPLVKSPYTFEFGEMPKIAQEELIKMINDTGIRSTFSFLSESHF
jgi:Mn-containing catalase